MTEENKDNQEEFPSLDQQLNNLSKFVFEIVSDVTSTGDFTVFCDDDIQKERMDICRMCEYYAPKQDRCKKCGCWLEHKVKFIAATCPIDRW